MDPDSPVAIVERTFWTVWCYITEAVNRFFRPEPTDAVSSDPNAVQDSPASTEPTDGRPTEDSTDGGGHGGERPLAPASLLRSSGVVSWDSGYGPAKQRKQSKSQQREDAESKASEEQKTKREERFDQTGSGSGGHATAEKSEEEHEKCEMHECELEEGDGEMEKHMATDVKEEDNVNKGDAGSQGTDGDTVVMHKDVGIPVSVLQTSPKNQNQSDEGDNVSNCEQLSENSADVQGDADVEQLMAHRSDKDEGDANILQEREQGGQENRAEPAHKQTADENPEQEEEAKTDESLSELVTDSHEVSPDASTELNTEEEQEDVAEITKTKIREADGVSASTTCVLLNDTRVESTRVEEQHKSSEEDDQGGNIEIRCAPTSVTVNPEAEPPQENVPLRMCGGWAVVLQSALSEETPEGVPEYNNEPGPDENTSQTFLEVGDGKEIQPTLLPEEVESLQNSGSAAAAEDLAAEEQEEEQDVPRRMDAELLQDIAKPLIEQVIQDSRRLFENEGGNISGHSMKTGIELSETESETNTVLADDTAAELHVRAEEPSAALEADARDAPGGGPEAAGGLSGFSDDDAELLRIMNTSVFKESDENCNVISSLLEDITGPGFLKQSGEGEAHGDHTVEMPDVARQGTGYEPEEGAAEDELQNKSHMGTSDVQLVDVKAEPIKETLPTELDKALEISNEQMLKDTEATDELIITELQSKPLTVISEEEMAEADGTYTEETSRGHEGVIDEEILDLWIQAVASEDTDQIKQQEGPEQQTDPKIQPSHEEMSSEMEREQRVESNAAESELMRDTEMSGFSDQPLKLTGTESFQDMYDMLASMTETADSSDLTKQQIMAEHHDAADAEQSNQKEEESVPEPGFNTDSGVLPSEAGHQEPCKSGEGSDGEHAELLERDTGSQKEADAEIPEQNNETDWKDAEEAGVELQANGENVDDIRVEIFPNETKHYEPERLKSGSDVMLEEEVKFTETSSQVDSGDQPDTSFELPSPEVGPKCCGASLPELHMTEVVEHPAITFQDLPEVDGASLDFTAQRSRIALKNPRVRRPKHPRSLLHIPSLEPTAASHQQVKAPAGLPLGGLGVGIKLPGLGGGFPVLKKTRVVADEDDRETSKEPETKPEDKSEPPKQDEVQKPKWMPPKHPGFGNPLMSELKTKLKKTTQE